MNANAFAPVLRVTSLAPASAPAAKAAPRAEKRPSRAEIVASSRVRAWVPPHLLALIPRD